MGREGFIPDGYTVSHTIKAQPGFFDNDVTIHFRPLTKMEQVDRSRKISGKTGIESEKIANGVIVERLKEWDLTYPAPTAEDPDNREPVEITVENLSRLEPELAGELLKVVMGLAPTEALEESQKN